MYNLIKVLALLSSDFIENSIACWYEISLKVRKFEPNLFEFEILFPNIWNDKKKQIRILIVMKKSQANI